MQVLAAERPGRTKCALVELRASSLFFVPLCLSASLLHFPLSHPSQQSHVDHPAADKMALYPSLEDMKVDHMAAVRTLAFLLCGAAVRVENMPLVLCMKCCASQLRGVVNARLLPHSLLPHFSSRRPKLPLRNTSNRAWHCRYASGRRRLHNNWMVSLVPLCPSLSPHLVVRTSDLACIPSSVRTYPSPSASPRHLSLLLVNVL